VQRRSNEEHPLPTFSLFQPPELDGLIMRVSKLMRVDAYPQVGHTRGHQAGGCQPILN
jgi:hypothetical protein